MSLLLKYWGLKLDSSRLALMAPPPKFSPAASRPVRDWPEYAGERDTTTMFSNGVAPYW